MEEDKVKKKKIQYTKKIITTLIVASIIWITWSYGMATYALIVLGLTDPLSELSIRVCITIIGVVVSYCLKSYFETKAEKDNEMMLHMENDFVVDDFIVDEEIGGISNG